MVGAQSGFAVAFQEFIYYAGPIVQILYWVVLAVAAIYAVVLLKRLVDHKTGGVATKAADTVTGEPVRVDEFVE